MRRYRAADPERAREQGHRWRAANLERSRRTSREYQRRRRATNPEGARVQDREYKHRLRAALLAFLGGKCERCGTARDLHVHHVNGDGDEHRKRAGGRIGSYLEILSGAYPREACALVCNGCHNKIEPRKGMREERKV